MNIVTINRQDYRISSSLNPFQQKMQIHLINWKWKYITRDAGKYRGQEYDAILPDSCADQWPVIHHNILEKFKRHHQEFPFQIHKHYNHMASSQFANANLFLPVLTNPAVNDIFRALRPDFASLATDQLDNGYRIEYWDEPYNNLGDKNNVSGTDSDIAIAYYNHDDELCLWLIEHKLTEHKFSNCGVKEDNKKTPYDCTKSLTEILADKNTCYYHDVNKYNFWDITEAHCDFFINHNKHKHCPFEGGMNQLWRNQLLALSIEQDERQPYKHTSFSVVRHPDNYSLDKSIAAYKDLIDDNKKFSVFTSADVIKAASAVGNAELNKWIAWYCDLYMLPVPGGNK